MKSFVVWIMWLALGASSAFADEKVKVEVSVNAVSGGSYYLDKGRADGLEAGDRVVFFPSTGSTTEGTIRAVSKNSARVDLDPGSTAIVIGDRGEVFIPRERVVPPPVKPQAPPPVSDSPVTPSAAQVAQQPTPPTAKPPVEHPAWTHPPEEWQKDKPLLAPAFGLSPEERERRIRGRAWLQSQYTHDSQSDTRTYTNSSAGVDATMENPFGQGGELRFDATVWTRSFDVDAEDLHDTQSRLRLNRFAYSVGGTEDEPTRWSFGRFLQRGLPEFGLLDGVEWNRRLANSDEIGVSVGAMPVPSSSLSSFDDTQVAAFYRRALDDERKNTLGLGYQNTWHKGEQDRNLFLAEARVQPGRDVSIRSSAWLDVYGSEDEIKGSGIELTELLFNITWRTSALSGLGVTLSHRRIPELLRSELQDLDPSTIRDSELDRIALNGWTSLSPKVRLDGRVDHWSDQDDDGTAAEIGATLRDILWSQGEIRPSLFYSDGSFSSGPGLRLVGSKSFGRSAASLGYEYIDYEQKDFSGEQTKLAQQSLFATFDWPVFDNWDMSLIGDKRFGDSQDSWSLGLLLQTRF